MCFLLFLMLYFCGQALVARADFGLASLFDRSPPPLTVLHVQCCDVAVWRSPHFQDAVSWSKRKKKQLRLSCAFAVSPSPVSSASSDAAWHRVLPDFVLFVSRAAIVWMGEQVSQNDVRTKLSLASPVSVCASRGHHLQAKPCSVMTAPHGASLQRCLQSCGLGFD